MAEWFGEAPANTKACAETADKNFCATFHADDEAYFDQVWYWTTPIDAVPRRPHQRQVQGLRRLDHGLAGDQGLTSVPGRAGPALLRAARVGHPAPPPAAAARGLLVGADGLAGRRLPRRAGDAAALGVLDDRRLHRRGRHAVHARELPRRCSPTASTARSRCARIGVAAAVTVIARSIAFPMAFFMAKVASPRAQRCWSSRCSRRCGRATWSRPTPGGRCSPSDGVAQLDARAARAARPRLSA